VSGLLLGVGWALALSGWGAFTITRVHVVRRAEAIARTCHELRGPLTAARLGVELSGPSGQLSKDRLRAIELELARATLAVEDLSRIAGCRRGRREWLSRDPEGTIDVVRLLADSVEAWRPAAAARGVELRLVGSDVRPFVRGSQLRLAQAIGNLIANAIEHGGGRVEVGWRIDQATTRIEVVDGGPGLPAPVAELIAGRPKAWPRWLHPTFWGLGAAAVGRRGHGLAIAHAVAAAHGGRLAAAPTDHGARLVLVLPNARADGVRRPAG
jgi:signal transduction histidine kinase